MGTNTKKLLRRATCNTIAGLAAFALTLLAGQDGYAITRQTESPIDNPDLNQACGLNVLMILDESGSIGDNDDDVRDAFKAFTAAIKNTSSSMAVAEFSKVARLPAIGPVAPGEYITVTDTTKGFLDDYVDNDYNPGGNTNWEDGLRMGNYNFAVRPDYTVPHLTVFITDGDPTRVIKNSVSNNDYANKVPLSDDQTTNADKNPAADAAVRNANDLKRQGSHILVIAVGNGVTSSASLNRIIKISGPDVYPDGGAPFDITTDDVYREPNFSELEDALREAAFQLCSPSVTVAKVVDLTPDPDSLDDAVPGPSWEITGEILSAPGGAYDWILPTLEQPGTGPQSTLTDASGFATFQWRPTATGNSVFRATEEDRAPGIVNDTSRTSCTFRTPDQGDTPLPLDSVGNATFDITIQPESIVTCQFVNIAAPNSQLTLEKFTEGQDADLPPGPVMPRGELVNWSYVVTNTGNTRLGNIQVVDEVVQPAAGAGQAIPVQCPKAALVQGERMICEATGVSGSLPGGGNFTGQYENLATVTAIDSLGNPVGPVTDPSHYFEVEPGIAVEKFTNGEDADRVPGPLLDVGTAITWLYEVRNTGSEPLSNVIIDDDQEGPPTFIGGDTNNNNQLDVGEVWIYNNSGVATPGQYQNTATVSGDGAAETVQDQDPSHYFGADPGIAVEKSTNGEDADLPPGPVLSPGDTVTWTYTVTNTGNLPFNNWNVSDDQGVTVSCPKIVLVPGASAVCSGSGIAQAGQYANVATASANDPAGGPDVTDTDPSHYLGSVPALDVEKSTNGEDADEPTGPFVPLGDTVNWTYVVTNRGNVPLREVTVVDSELEPGDVTCPSGVILDPNDSITCTASGVAVAGQYRNFALTLGLPPGTGAISRPVGDFDPSHYFGAEPGIGLEKYTQGIDADLPENAARVPIGDVVEWTYIVFNTGNDALGFITVTDDQGVVPIFQDGDTNNNLLDVDEQWRYTAQGVATPGLYANIGSVSGIDATDTEVTDTDPSHYFGFDNAITVEKSTNGVDADFPPGPNLFAGTPVTWEYVVTNTGASPTPLEQIQLKDDQLGIIAGPDSGDTNGNGLLDPTETWIYSATGTAVDGQYANLATVSGIGAGNEEVEDTDPSHYFGGPSNPGIQVEKFTNGQDADVAPGPLLEVGSNAVFVYVVLNTGDVPVQNVTVSDDQGVALTCAGGNPIPQIEVGDFGYCVGTTAVGPGQYRNVGSAQGTGILGTPVNDDDPSHHFGYAVGPGGETVDVDIEKATNGVDADQPPGPLLLIQEPVAFTYEVTNTGNVPLSNLAVDDDQGVAVDCPAGNPIPLLLPGENQICSGDATVVAGQYRNLGSVLAQGPGTATADDEDPSHHRGLTRNELFGVPATPVLALLLTALGVAGLGLAAAGRQRRRNR